MLLRCRTLLLGGCLLFLNLFAFAQEERDLGPVSTTYLLSNATVVQGPGRKLEKAFVLIKDGLIKSVTTTRPNDPTAIVIPADSLFVYSAFIDGLSRTGVIKPKEENRERPKDPGNPDPERAGITPAVDVRNVLGVGEKSLEEWRNLGFAIAQVAPYGGMMPGHAALISLGSAKSADQLVLVRRSGMYGELTGAQRVYPNTNYAVMAKWREIYRNASIIKDNQKILAAGERPVSDRILEAFFPVIDKQIPMIFKADKVLEIQRILALQKDLGFKLVLVDVKEGWDNIALIKASGAVVFLSLDLPEEPKKETTEPETAEWKALKQRREEMIRLYDGQAAAFQKAGIPFGFSALSAKVKDVPANLRRMIKAGLTEDQALAALTTVPAGLLGIGDRAGTVDPGKLANLVVTQKPYFNEKSVVKWVFVDGQPYKQEVKAKEDKKASDSKTADAAGQWNYSTETGQGTVTGVLALKKSPNGYMGTITSSLAEGTTELQDVKLEGTRITGKYQASIQGNSFEVRFSLKLDGDTFSGDFSTDSYGSFPVKGKREPKNQ